MSLEAIGAFLTGVGSVLGAFYAFRRVVRRAEEECQERLRAFKDGLREGRKL